ncbi:hypothetical protein KAR91_81410 [Candidatus Pacearchaeota archaeon]|nr:hypothetical protein [Candidatus Pacearchaeota archaeon]
MTRGVKTKLTKAQWKKMGDCALDGCRNSTIAGIMDIPKKTIDDNKEIRTFLWKKRCLRYRKKRKEQDKHAVTTPAMSIFQGKNELGQSDKKKIGLDATKEAKDFMDWLADRNGDNDDS